MGADNLRVLSADAPKTGLRKCCERFSKLNRREVKIDLLTAPRIVDRVVAGEADADVIVIPLPLLEQLADGGHVDGATIAPLGSVAVGVVVRNGKRDPDLSSVESFRHAVLAADAVVYNTASSGVYVAGMLKDLGVADEISGHVVVVPTGASVMEQLAGDEANAIGFCHVTEIRLHDDRGTHLVGPLPGRIGRTTTYAAGAAAGGLRLGDARALIEFLSSPSGRRTFKESGVL